MSFEFEHKGETFKDKVDEYWTNNPSLKRPSSRAIRLCSNNFENTFALAWADFIASCNREGVYPFDVPKCMVMNRLLYNRGLNKFMGKHLINKIDKLFEEAEFGDIEW